MLPFLGLKSTSKKKEQRASPENPSTSLSNPDAWLWDALGAGANRTAVTKKTALSIPSFNAAVGRRGRTIGSLSCKIFEKTENGLLEAAGHPLFSILNRTPNPLYNRAVFWTAIITNYDTDGEAFTEIIRNDAGRVVRLDIIQKSQVVDLQKVNESYYFMVKKKEIINGRLQEIEKAVAISNMLWFRDMSFDGLQPLNKVETFRNTLATGIAANDYSQHFFENGAQIPFIVTTPLEMSPGGIKRFRDEWKKLFTGIKNFFKRPLLLDKGMDAKPLKMTPQEAQMTSTKKQVTEDTARITDVPAHMIGGGERFTFSSIEMMQTDFVRYSLRNTIVQFQLEMENKLLTDSERENYKIKFNIDSLLQGDIKTRTEKLINEYKWGLLKKNEYRKLAGYMLDEGGDGYFNPVNMFWSKAGEEPVNPAVNDNNNG